MPASKTNAPAGAKARLRRVLIIEPSPDFCSCLEEFLTGMKFEIRGATSGDEGLKQLKAFNPDLVLLSRELPLGDGKIGPDGLRVLKLMKQDRKLARVPVIMASSEATEKDFDRYRKLKFSAEDYIRKPFEDTEILRRIENLVGFDLSENLDHVKDNLDDHLDDPLLSIFDADPEELGLASSAATRRELSQLLEQVGQELARQEDDFNGSEESAEESAEMIQGRESSPAAEEAPANPEEARLRQELQTRNRQLDLAQKQLVGERRRSREIKKEWTQKLTEIAKKLQHSEKREEKMREEFGVMRERFADLELEHTMELERVHAEKRHLEEDFEAMREKLAAWEAYPPDRLAGDVKKAMKTLETILGRLAKSGEKE